MDCLLDGDRAGQQAAMRILPMALRNGMDIGFLPLLEGQDPDDLLREGGLDAFNTLVESAQSAIGFAVKIHLPNASKASPQDRQHALSLLYPIVRECPSSVMQDEYLNEISHLTLVDRNSLEHDFRNTSTRPRNESKLPEAKENHSEWLTSAEDELLLLVLHHGEISSEVARVMEFDWINSDTLAGRLLLRFLEEIRTENHWLEIEPINQLLEDDSEHNFIYAFLARNPDYENPVEVANKAMSALHKKYVEEHIKLLRNELASAQNDQAKKILATIKDLREQLKETPFLTHE